MPANIIKVSELQKIQAKVRKSIQYLNNVDEQTRKREIKKKARWYLEGFDERVNQKTVEAANKGENETIVQRVGPFWVAGWFDKDTKEAAEMAVAYARKRYDGFNFRLAEDGYIWVSWPESS